MITKLKIYTLFYLFSLCMLNLSCEEFFLGPDIENTPENNFEMLWNEFDHYYPSFIIKNIDWDSLYLPYKVAVSSCRTEDELWSVLTLLLSHFNDGHVYMYNKDHSKYFNSSSNLYLGMDEFSLELIKEKYLNNNYQITSGGRITYSKLNHDSIGYIHISDFSGDINEYQKFGYVISSLNNVNTLIIDLRANRGGLHSNYRYVASHLINQRITYLQEISRNGPNHSDFTDPYFQFIDPIIGHSTFTNNIIFLVNRQTASAAELFLMVLKNQPYAKIIGDSTNGSLGYTYRYFVLPNGWSYYMPNSLNLTVEGQSIENIGIIPDVYFRNTNIEILQGFDRLFEYTIKKINN